MPFHLYILRSEASGRFYIGQTKDLAQRVAYHNANYSKSLKNRGPWRLVHTEDFATRSEAVRRESLLKSWKDRGMIEALVNGSHHAPKMAARLA
jgi:putative endonuclease